MPVIAIHELRIPSSGADMQAPPRVPPTVELSLVIPAYNEQDNVLPLYAAIMAHVPQLGRSFEVVFVDDGSTDATFDRLAGLAARDPRVRVIKLRRNYGQTPAMVAGIDHARGRVLVTMDADLQNDPADVGRLLEKLDGGFDLVIGWRQNRQDKLLSRRLPSVLANRLIARVTGIAVRDNGCTLKAFRADMIRDVPLYAEMHRFIPAMTSILGCRLAEIGVRHHARRYGQSKYGLSRVYKVLLDLIAIKALLVFARRPLFCFVGTAAICTFLSLICFAVVLYDVVVLQAETTVVIMGISLLFGSLALFLGLVGVITSLTYQHFLDPEESVDGSAAWLGVVEEV